MPYSTKADLRNLYGTENVARWSNLDNVTSADDDTRINAAIAWADDYVDTRFRDSKYAVPLSATAGGVPAQVTDIAARLAGWWLYQSRGMADEDPAIGGKLAGHRMYADRQIDRILAGVDRLAAVRADRGYDAPEVVRCDSPPPEWAVDRRPWRA